MVGVVELWYCSVLSDPSIALLFVAGMPHFDGSKGLQAVGVFHHRRSHDAQLHEGGGESERGGIRLPRLLHSKQKRTFRLQLHQGDLRQGREQLPRLEPLLPNHHDLPGFAPQSILSPTHV